MRISSCFKTPIFYDIYAGVSNEINIKETKYYKSKKPQSINLQKEKIFKPLINKIKESTLDISKNVFKITKPYSVDVVSLWSNKRAPNTDHTAHMHQNTFLSGVFFLEDTQLPLCFLRPQPLPVLPIVDEYNEFNCNKLRHHGVKDCMVLFPSYLYHFVSINEDKKSRLTLAFDIMLRGEYGEIDQTTVGQYKI
jgi:uncharacterized protein (TIGR02466 family)